MTLPGGYPPRGGAGVPLVVDVVDRQSAFRLGVAAVLTHAPGFRAGEVLRSLDELPPGRRPAVVGLTRVDPREVAAVRRLAEQSRPVLALLPGESSHVWAVVRQHVTGGLPRSAPAARVVRALRAVSSGQSYWWRDLVELGKGTPTIVASLSDRERELLGLLAVGCSDREIADQLMISVRTVWSHLERIRAKTGVRGRVELAMLAWHGRTSSRPEAPRAPRKPASDEHRAQDPAGRGEASGSVVRDRPRDSAA